MSTSVSWTVGDNVKQPQGRAGHRTTRLEALRMPGTEQGFRRCGTQEQQDGSLGQTTVCLEGL